MAWLFLITAGLFECGWAIGLKYTDGFSRPIPSLLTILALVISMWALSIAMKTIPVGTAYAVWTGIGAVGVSVLGMVLFGESRELVRLVFLTAIIGGVIGLSLVTPA
jgi:quaternary ammonium compound-resistance protein SugE